MSCNSRLLLYFASSNLEVKAVLSLLKIGRDFGVEQEDADVPDVLPNE